MDTETRGDGAYERASRDGSKEIVGRVKGGFRATSEKLGP